MSETWPPAPINSAKNDATAGAGVDCSGTFIYGLSFVNGDLMGYHINPDGTLSPVPGSPFVAGSYPNESCHCVAIDPKGSFVYAVSPTFGEANSPDNKIYAFTIDHATGSLTPIAGSPFATGQAPVSVRSLFFLVSAMSSNPFMRGRVMSTRINAIIASTIRPR